MKKNIYKAYRFRLSPNKEQTSKLYQMAGCGRVVYNDSLQYLLGILKKESGIDDKKTLYKHLNALPLKARREAMKQLPKSGYSLGKLLTASKKKESRAWLKEAYSSCLDQRNNDLWKAVKRWEKNYLSGFPVFRTRRLAHHSTMRFHQFKKQCKLEHNRIKLTGKLGFVRFFKSQEIEGNPKLVTVTLDPVGRWHIAIMCEVEIKVPDDLEGEQCGIDMGIAKNITCSTDICGDDGVFVGVNSFRELESRLVYEQRLLARKELGSSNWKKQKTKVAKLHDKIANIRKDYIQKATTEITEKHSVVFCEDLKVKNMSKSAKGDNENHGKKVKQKAGLNKRILDQGWGEIRRQLEYKMEWKGGWYGAVNPKNTSRECCSCGHTDKENRKTQAKFKCVSCGHEMNADKNAAANILVRGLRAMGA